MCDHTKNRKRQPFAPIPSISISIFIFIFIFHERTLARKSGVLDGDAGAAQVSPETVPVPEIHGAVYHPVRREVQRQPRAILAGVPRHQGEC